MRCLARGQVEQTGPGRVGLRKLVGGATEEWEIPRVELPRHGLEKFIELIKARNEQQIRTRIRKYQLGSDGSGWLMSGDNDQQLRKDVMEKDWSV